MSEYAVSTVFKAKDAVSAVFGKMGRQAGFFGDEADRAFRKASRSGSRFGDIVKGILFTDVLKGGLSQLRRGVSSVTEEFILYDNAITSASAKFKGLNLQSKEGIKTLINLKSVARELGATTEFTSSQAAEGLEFLAMAGFSAEQSIATLPGVVDLATTAKTDLARATDIASDALGAFGLQSKNTAKLQQNLTRINDVFAKTTVTANTDMEMLFEAVKKGAPTFTDAGQKMETFAAMAGVLAGAGVKGGEGGTALRNMLQRLSKPTAEAAKVLDKLNVTVQDSDGNFRDAIDILADFEKGLKGVGSAERTAALATVFEARAATGVSILLKKGSEGLREYRDSLIDSSGAAISMADVIRGSLGNQLATLRSASIELGFKVMDAFEGKIGPAIERFTETIRGIDVPAIVEGFKSFYSTLSKFSPVFYGMAAAFATYTALFAAFAILTKIKAFMAFVVVLKSTAAAMGILNAVMASNPIGLVAVAIGTLVAGVILLRENWDAVVASFKSGFGVFSKLSEWFGGDVEKKVTVERESPNAALLAAQRVQFTGRLDINGAPEGSKAEAETTGAPSIDMSLSGKNL